MIGFEFLISNPINKQNQHFSKLFEILKKCWCTLQCDVTEALSWLKVDREYKITNNEFTMADFIDDLKNWVILKMNSKMGHTSCRLNLNKVFVNHLWNKFWKVKKIRQGNHKTPFTGKGDEQSSDLRAFQFGDSLEQINMTESIRNAQINHGTYDFNITENDLEIVESEHKAQTSTVLMIDISQYDFIWRRPHHTE